MGQIEFPLEAIRGPLGPLLGPGLQSNSQAFLRAHAVHGFVRVCVTRFDARCSELAVLLEIMRRDGFDPARCAEACVIELGSGPEADSIREFNHRLMSRGGGFLPVSDTSRMTHVTVKSSHTTAVLRALIFGIKTNVKDIAYASRMSPRCHPHRFGWLRVFPRPAMDGGLERGGD